MFFDGSDWQQVRSNDDIAALETALELYITDQLSHMEYRLALKQSVERSDFSAFFSEKVTELSDYFNDQSKTFRSEIGVLTKYVLNNSVELANKTELEINTLDLPDEVKTRMNNKINNLTDNAAQSALEKFDVHVEEFQTSTKAAYELLHEAMEVFRKKHDV